MSSIIPSPWPVAHIARWIDTAAATDEHGNYPIVEDPPVIRWVYEIIQAGRPAGSREVMGEEFSERIATTLQMACHDPTVYKNSDQVLVYPELDAAQEYVPGTGIAYWVDGDPSDERVGPWPHLLAWAGGVVELKRVT